MFAFVRRYEVEEHSRPEFETAFGPRGDWARLFAQSPAYRGIELFRDQDTYLVLCVWESRETLDAFLEDHRQGIADLDLAMRALTRCSHALGEYEVLEPA